MEAAPEQLREMSRAARHHCYEHYRIGAVVDKWLSLYNDYVPVA